MPSKNFRILRISHVLKSRGRATLPEQRQPEQMQNEGNRKWSPQHRKAKAKWRKGDGSVLFVPNVANLLNRGRGLRNVIQTLSFKNQFIFDVGRDRDFDTFMQFHSSHKLFS